MNGFFSKVENIFIIFCLFWGILFLIINPPFQASDESSHMFKMYGFSEGAFGTQKKTINGETQAGLILPVNLVMLSLQGHDMLYDSSKKTSFAETKQLFNLKLDQQKTAFCAFGVPSYTPISYFPAIIILLLMKLFNVAPLIMMYILRFCTLLTYIAMIYFAIKITPVKKWLFFSAAVVPQAIYFASAINTDAIVTGYAYLSLAYTLRLAFDSSIQKLTLKQIILLALSYSLLNICKFPYITMCLLIFLIPKEKFECIKTRNVYFSYIFLINILIDIFIVGAAMLSSQGTISINQTNNLPLTTILKYIFLTPNHPIKILYQNFIQNGFYYLQGAFAFFGWSNVAVAPWISYSYIFLLGISGIINDKNEPEFSIKITHKLIFAAIFIFMTLITAFVGFAIFGIPLGPEIFIYQAKLFQGRYWIPLLPILFLILNVNKARLNTKWFKIFSIFCFSFLLFLCSIALLFRFYMT